MQTYRVETIVSNDGTITIKNLPFYAGDKMDLKLGEFPKDYRLVTRTVLILVVSFILTAPYSAKCEETVKTAELTYVYKKNAAFNDFLKHRDEYEKSDQFDFAAKLSKHKEVSSFNNYIPYHLWAVYLVKHGIKIREQLDGLSVELNKYDDSSKGDPKLIENILDKLIAMQQSKMHYEEDVAEFIATFIATGIAEKMDQVGTINLITNEINRSYDRIFNLATCKLNNISNAKSAETNTTLSRKAVNLAIFAIIIAIAIGFLQIIVSIFPLFRKGVS